MDLLKGHPEYSATKIASEIGISSKAVEKHLAKFKAAGTIIREGPDKGGRRILKQKFFRAFDGQFRVRYFELWPILPAAQV